jgi:hypothetical protein
MNRINLGQARNNLYFWPVVTLSAIAAFFFGWAGLLYSQNWLGQGIWGAFATLIAVYLLIMGIRESRLAAAQRRPSGAPMVTVP